jgi:hypothetical protein
MKEHKEFYRIPFLHTGDQENLFLLGINVGYAAESQPKFMMNIPPPISGSKNMPNKKTG